MIESTKPFEQALEELDRNAIAGEVALAESQRKELLERFPREHWPEMTLEEYAIGHDRYPEQDRARGSRDSVGSLARGLSLQTTRATACKPPDA